MRRCNRADGETERKTRELDGLNRRLQRAVDAAPGEESLGASLAGQCSHRFTT